MPPPRASESQSAISAPLRSVGSLSAFAAVALLVAALLAWQTVRIAGSEFFAASMTPPSLARAVALWPANAEAHYRLGLLNFDSVDHPDSAEAVRQARLATELGPSWVRYWGQLAWACEAAGDTACADKAIAKVRQLAPMDIEAISLAANYYLASGRPELALQEFRQLLRIAPDRSHDVFRVCEAAGYPAAQLEQAFIEAGPPVVIAYLRYLADVGKLDAANQVWNVLLQDAQAGRFPLTLALVNPYINRLMQLGDGEQLGKIRLDLEKVKVVQDDVGVADNLVFNGGFERPITNDGLDWRTAQQRYTVVDFAAGVAHQGRRCLRVNFRVGANETYLLAFQFVPLEPNSHYVLSAYVRSDSITSDSGPRLQIFDPMCDGCLNAITESTVGTTPWHQVKVDFSTGPRTQLGRLEVVRLPSRLALGDITGVFWLDDVSLRQEPNEMTAQVQK